MRVRVSWRNGPSTMHGPKWESWRTVFIFLSPLSCPLLMRGVSSPRRLLAHCRLTPGCWFHCFLVALPPCESCCFSPNICLLLPELCLDPGVGLIAYTSDAPTRE